MTGFERAELVGSIVRHSFKERKGEISAAHNFGHVARVAENATRIVLALGGTENEAELARTASYLHDFYRSLDERVDDEDFSAGKAEPILNGLKKFSEPEIRTILIAMKTHSVPAWLAGLGDSKHIARFKQVDLIQFAVFAADKLEQNGPFAMARRSQFVGGERLSRGDLKELRDRLQAQGHPLAGRLTPAIAVLLESYIRLGKKNNPSLYPKWFRPVVDELFEQQKDFYYSLLKANNLHEEDLASLLKELKFPGMTAKEVDDWEANRFDSKPLIDAKAEEEVQAALEVVEHFSSPKFMRMDTKGAINHFDPKTKKAREWHAGMLSYLSEGIKPLIEKIG